MTGSLRRVAFLLVTMLVPAMSNAADATLFRIYLTDGSSLVSFGEYARLNDQVVFSMPVGGPAETPRLQVITLRSAVIDWPRTEQAATSARYQRYASTRAEEDYAILNNEVAQLLNDIALSTDRVRVLAMAEQARRTLADWPRTHFGYRQDDVREIVGLLDEAIARLKGTPPTSSFELSLVATPQLSQLDPPVKMPSARESVDSLLRLAKDTPLVPDRVALLQSALPLVSDPSSGYSSVEGLALRRSIEGQIRDEAVIDGRYATLTQRLLTMASQAASHADIDGVQRVLNRIPREDVRLGGRRPEAVQSMRAAVEAQLDAARRLRLLRDQFVIRRDVYRQYQKTIESQVLQLVKAQPSLEAIRSLQGPPPDRLTALRSRLSGGAARLERVQVIEDLRPTHDLLVNAWRFAEHAADVRYAAVTSGNVNTAWEASSAAAGALMMLSRAQQAIRELLEPPHLP
jgi:hypothetical protein